MSFPNQLYLISNGSPAKYPHNTLTHFVNQLPDTIDFGKNENTLVSIEAIGFQMHLEMLLYLIISTLVLL
jgi:hypothetical protein